MMIKTVRLLFISCFGLFLIVSCDGNKLDEPDFEFLISEEYNRMISKQSLEFFWSAAGQPEALSYIDYDVNLYRVVYHTVDAEGDAIEASGAIMVPKGAENPGLISIQHATIFSNDEAPSVDQGFSVADQMAIFASAGYITFLPDYLGYGVTSEMQHPYQQEKTLATASYDMVMAGREFIESNGLDGANSPLNLVGYSEGAYATLALARLIETTSTGFNTGLISMGAPIFDLTSTIDYIVNRVSEPVECIACYAYFLYSYHQVYDFPRPLSDYFTAPYDQLIADGLFSGEFTAEEISSRLPEELDVLLTDSFIERYLNNGEPELKAAAAENDLFYIPDAPVLLVHGDADGVAPIFNSDDFEQRALSAGKTQFEYLRPGGVNHTEGIFPWGLATLEKL